MSFLAILLSLLLDQWLRHLESMRGPRWFHAYFEGLGFLAHRVGVWRAALGALMIVLVPTVVVLFLGHLLDRVWDVLGLGFAVLILLLTLGPKDLHAEARAYIDATQSGNADQADRLARELLGAPLPVDSAARANALTCAVLSSANDRLFGVLFWFAVLGPAGAVLFRSADFLRTPPQDEIRSPDFCEAVDRLYGILAWVPAHLTALAYALAGSFEDAIAGLKTFYSGCTARFFQVNNDVLVCVGLAALHGSSEESGTQQLHASLMLVRRALIIWLVVYALITLFGWSW